MKRFLLVALVLAGCSTPAAEVDPAALAADAPPAFAAPLAMNQPTGGAEPNIAILPDGTIFITAVAGSQERPNHERGAAWLWRSTDGGGTWETLRAPQRDTPLGTPDAPNTRKPFGSSDADVITSPDGWVYYSDWWNWGQPMVPPSSPVPLPVGAPVSATTRYGSYLVERSSDGGATWESTSITTLDSLGGIDRQWLVAGPEGFVGLFYSYFHGRNPSRLTYSPDTFDDGGQSIEAIYSTDHGATWSNPAPVVPPVEGQGYQIGHARLSNGTLWMPYGDAQILTDEWTDPSKVMIAISHDLGATWEQRVVADVPGGFDNLWAVQGAADDVGGMHVAWAARTNDTMTIFYAGSTDDGMTWSAPVAVRSTGLNFLPWVAARGNGEVAISFYGGNSTGDPTEAADDAEWFAYVTRRATPDGAWRVDDAGSGPVKVGPVCPKGAACSANRELLDYSSVAFDPAGGLHLSFATSREVGGVKAGLVNYVAAVG